LMLKSHVKSHIALRFLFYRHILQICLFPSGLSCHLKKSDMYFRLI
jgi:hypothetical protein